MRDAEVDHADPSIGSHEQIARLDVAMHDSSCMCLCDRVTGIHQEIQRIPRIIRCIRCRVEGEIGDPAGIGNQFHRDPGKRGIRAAVVEIRIERSNDPRMIEALKRLDFSAKPIALIGSAAARFEELDRSGSGVRAIR